MPSPGIPALEAVLATSYTIGGYAAHMEQYGTTVVKLATGMDSGWVCVSPTIPSDMEVAILAAFGAYLGPASQGYRFIQCCGRGIDQEVDAWIASWDVVLQIHTYTVNAASIKSRILACAPFVNAATTAIAQAVADAFMSGFGQETG